MKIATKDVIERFKLVPKLSLFLWLLVDVDSYSRFSIVSNRLSKIKSVGVKNHKVVSTKEHRNVRQIVDRIKTKPKLSNFFGFLFFCATVEFSNVLKILILKLRVVVDP